MKLPEPLQSGPLIALFVAGVCWATLIFVRLR